MQTNGTRSRRVLVVDDASCFREAARQLLESRGYLVAGEADCAAEARKAVVRLAPDAILLDVNLPDANGFDLAAELLRSHPEVAILLVSADDTTPALIPQDPARPFVSKSGLATLDLAEFLSAPSQRARQHTARAGPGGGTSRPNRMMPRNHPRA